MGACTHGMPSPASCWECMEDGNLVPPKSERLRDETGVFRARFDGDCPSCGLAIHVGQEIRRWSDDRYRHASCHPSGLNR